MADRPGHLRDPAAGADRAAAGRGRGRCGRAARSSCSAPSLRDERASELVRASGVAPGRAAGRAPGRPARRVPPSRCAGPGRGRRAADFFDTGQEVGYHTAMEYRFVAGSLSRARAGDRLDADAPPAGRRARRPRRCSGVLIAADSGNGASATLDLARYLFINVDLSVHLHRLPVGEWVCLDAVTIPQPTRDRPRRHARCTTSAGRSGARCRRCSSASAERPSAGIAEPPRAALRCRWDGGADHDRARRRPRGGSQRAAPAARRRGRPRGASPRRATSTRRFATCAAHRPDVLVLDLQHARRAQHRGRARAARGLPGDRRSSS